MAELNVLLVQLIRKHPLCTGRELADKYALNKRTLQSLLPSMGRSGLVHVADWKMVEGRWSSMWEVGAGYSLPRPRLPEAERIERKRLSTAATKAKNPDKYVGRERRNRQARAALLVEMSKPVPKAEVKSEFVTITRWMPTVPWAVTA